MGLAKRQNKSRRHSGGGRRPDKREKRQIEADARNSTYAELTLDQKLRALPPEPSAKKQRAKLLAQLEEQNNPKPRLRGRMEVVAVLDVSQSFDTETTQEGKKAQ